jgi:ER lumen protein retaining receptor
VLTWHIATGDLSHLASIFILLHKIVQLKVRSTIEPERRPIRESLTPSTQSCSGISFKSQVLYLIVYFTRYLGMPCHALISSQCSSKSNNP